MNTSSPTPLSSRLLRIVLAASVAGVLLGSEPILNWTEQLPATLPYQQELQTVAGHWNAIAESLRLTVPYNKARAIERQAQDVRFAPPPDQ